MAKKASKSPARPAKRTRKSPVKPAIDFVDIYANRFGPQTGRVKKANGAENIMGSGEDTVMIGMQMPFLMEYVTCCGVYPFGTVIELNGPSESHKTMLLYEIGRWFSDDGGFLDMTVTEGKISKTLARSVIGWLPHQRRRFVAEMAPTLDDAQKNIIDGMVKVKEMYHGAKTEKGAGAVFPVLFGVDSLNGANMKEKTDKITDVGSAQRAWGIEAGSLTEYLKVVASMVQPYPMSLVCIRHLKQEEFDPNDPRKFRKASKPGGKHVKFQATLELTTAVTKRFRTQDVHENGALLVEHCMMQIKNAKSSTGTNKRAIEVRVSWRDREIAGTPRQITKFHWTEALPKMLYDFQEGKLGTVIKNAKAGLSPLKHLDKFFHIRKLPSSKLYYSHTLGIRKEDAISPAVMGRLIEENPDARDSLRAAFGIPRGVVWESGTDYQKLLLQERLKSKERLSKQLDSKEEELMRLVREIEEEEI